MMLMHAKVWEPGDYRDSEISSLGNSSSAYPDDDADYESWFWLKTLE